MAKHEIVSANIVDTHDLGSGIIATATYSYVPPKDAPISGSEWDDNLDLPGVVVTLSLPASREGSNYYPTIVGPIRSTAKVFGQEMNELWGRSNEENDCRLMSRTYRQRSLALSLATARADVAKDIPTLRGVVAAREARLAKREATIAAAEEA